MKPEELVDGKKLRKRLRERCAANFKDGCDMDDDCESCPIMEHLLEGALGLAEELNVRRVYNVGPSCSPCAMDEDGRCEPSLCPVVGSFLIKRVKK